MSKGWNWLTLGDQHFLVFRYTDPMAGPSAKGVPVSMPPQPAEVRDALKTPGNTFRMPMGEAVPLAPAELTQLGLPDEPEWMQYFRPPHQPWYDDPQLSFHPEYPDDLQALFFVPSRGTVEGMWVRLQDVDPRIDGYRGTLLNDSHHNPELQSGKVVSVRVTAGVKQPIWVSDVARQNMGRYRGACEECGFDLVLVPVHDLIHHSFPDAPGDAVLEQFTTRCAMCQGTQVLSVVRN